MNVCELKTETKQIIETIRKKSSSGNKKIVDDEND